MTASRRTRFRPGTSAASTVTGLASGALRDRHRRPARARRLHEGRHRERGARVRELLLHDLYVVEARAVPGLERDRPPDAARHEARPPVPAVVVRRLAREHADHLGGLVVDGGQPITELAETVVLGLDVVDGRPEAHDDAFVPLTSCLRTSTRQARNMLSAESTDTPLTNTSANVSSPLNAELDALVREQHLVRGERRPVLPVRLLDPLQAPSRSSRRTDRGSSSCAADPCARSSARRPASSP
jgi:hypothetical protein